MSSFHSVAMSLLLASVCACSSTPGDVGACSAASKCTADPKPTQDAIKTCTKLASGVCGAQYSSANSCANAQQVCNAQNMTDVTQTANGVLANCGPQENAYTSCCSANPSACQ